MAAAMEEYGNPSSIHTAGRRAQAIVDKARRNIAQALDCTFRRIVFTGSGTEANNLAIKGVALANQGKRNHIITSIIEHPAVLNTCGWLENAGFRITYLSVDRYGLVDLLELEKTITDDTCLISIMTANNETGAIQPIRECALIARDRKILIHTDAVQAFGKIPVSIDTLGVDLLSVSAHKINGPKGVGALYVRKGIELESLINGGGHEFGYRSGTENVMGLAGFGKAAELIPGHIVRMEEVRKLRDRLEEGIRNVIKDCAINGHPEKRLPNTLNVTLPDFRAESVVLEMERRGVYLSSGSACKSGSSKPSNALLAMGLSEEQAHCALRFSLGFETTEEDIDYTIQCLADTVKTSRNMVHFVPCR
jgi:cysteine desulfurase NifS